MEKKNLIKELIIVFWLFIIGSILGYIFEMIVVLFQKGYFESRQGKKIYIILTHTGTVLSKIIKGFTKDEFSHVSIALDIELKEMYSFGRLNPNNPFCGGFVHEYIDKGTFKRFYKTRAKVYSLEVTE